MGQGIRRISAVTLKVSDMKRSLEFYVNALGLRLRYGGESAYFSSLHVGDGFLNLELSPTRDTNWGRVILYCDDVDEVYRRLCSVGIKAQEPRDAAWGERYFHVRDPDGHEISIAKPIA